MLHFTPQQLFDILWIPVCIQIGALALGYFLNGLIERYLRTAIDKESWQFIFVNAVRGLPISWCSGVGLYWTINSLDNIPATIMRLLSSLLFTVIIFTLTRVIARTLTGIIDFYTLRSGENLPKTSLLNNIVSFSIYAMGLLIILQYYGISVAPILTALGVGGMAVALGLQDTLANIFAGIHLILSKQLRIGDYIKLSSGEEGCVTDITWRFTKLQSVSNNVVVVPNQNIAKAIIVNYSMPKQDITVSVTIGVSYDSDLEKVERVCIRVAEDILSKYDPEIDTRPTVRYNLLADSSINFNVLIHVSKFLNQYIVKHEFIKAIIAEFRKENIDIPYPVRTIINESCKTNGNVGEIK